MSTLLYAATLKLTLALQPAWVERDEPAEQRKARIELVVRAVLSTTQRPEEVAALIRLGYEETKFAKYVLHGCQDIPKGASGNCDMIQKGSRKGQIRARSFWQLWARTCPQLWESPVGSSEAVHHAARCALRHWRFATRQCRKRPNDGPIAAAFSGYRTTMRCQWPPAKGRAWRYRQWLRKLRAELAQNRTIPITR